MRVALIDSPYANIANIGRALREVDAEVDVTADAAVIAGAEKIVLPGVGSFAAAMQWLSDRSIDAAILSAVTRGAALLGICVGHQLLFDQSNEMGVTRGLALLRGDVRRLPDVLPVPQIGWNRVTFDANPLFAGVASGTPFYFVNSFVAADAENETANAEYGVRFTAAVQKGRVFGAQFHPEKSSVAGLQVLRNFVSWN